MFRKNLILEAYWLVLLLLLLALVFPKNADAGGPVHGARAAGMGTAFVAIAGDAEAILYNPAGMTQIEGRSVYLGSTGLVIDTRYRSTVSADESRFRIYAPMHLYAVDKIEDSPLHLGLGIYSPFGIGGRTWSTTGPLRYVSTESTIATLAVNPALAWKSDLPPKLWTVRKAATTASGGLAWFRREGPTLVNSRSRRLI